MKKKTLRKINKKKNKKVQKKWMKLLKTWKLLKNKKRNIYRC